MELVRDILDKQILGRDDVKLGKVDGIVLELRDDEPPRVAFIELGSATFARRIGRRFERWAVMLNRRLRVRRPRSRIAFECITDYKLDVRVDLEAKRSPAFAWEHWVREHIIRRLPFAK
jgi:hypothetical protein